MPTNRRYPVYVGPLEVMEVKGSELIAGDVVLTGAKLLVVMRSYPLEHIRQQVTDVDDGFQDEHGDYKGPFHKHFGMDETYWIYRAASRAGATDRMTCLGCGCMPGDGRTVGCSHPDGCGSFAS
jgi:hypothetical protein